MAEKKNYTKGAAVMCNRPRFRHFLSEIAKQDIDTKEQAAAVIRDWCGIKSRRELDQSEKAGSAYCGLIAMYNDWLGGASV
ncbi:hypothetical protein CFE14_RS15990 [Vibrio parahaemolyticus]|nr:hypothetical protein [Vibrio parahaemolyticus]